MLIDVNVSFGYWPFQKFQQNALAKLSKHLTAEGISLALVSLTEAVFYPDSDVYNKLLFEKLKSYSNLMPLMVLNPSLPNWKETLERYHNLQKAKAIKIFPNYHNYSLSSAVIDDLIYELARRKMALVIQMRMEDERNQYSLLKVADVKVKEIIKLANRFSEIPIIVLCSESSEAVSLIKNASNIYVDISFVEFIEMIDDFNKVVFGSHTPFLYTHSAIMKIRNADVPEKDLNTIMSGNACRLFKLKV